MSPATPTPAPSDRNRLSVDLAPSVSLLLEHASTVLGVPRSQILVQALLEHLPGLLDRAEELQKRATAAAQPTRRK